MEKKKSPNLKKKLAECQKEKDEYLKGWQRARADFLNYKKDEAERVKRILKYANEDLVFKILPILDNFEKAEKGTPDNLKDDQYLKGVLQIKVQLQDLLKNQGVKEIEALDKKFDPNFHEVVEEVEVENKESGIIIEEIQKGYLIEDKLIRPSKVRVVK